ncbi:DUF3035 domain-containing protein [Commensalibacter oyaizuii]|uniref:DUF3035 domain-containing protein n=1 Tax=Commensalibacter oyaizuii TaxID=3043873 RepID=A0ABT6Q0M2_9PROT|nr:DUF3035 domain-containing protein [Commensalibacter sp. TBRC 16381]MDI2090535.1 DUF3035 domain-containing protein [Commensalibacter sp. TBRC 16381]
MVRKLSLNLFMPMGCLMGAAVLLSACSGEDVSRAFGLKRSMPDEYTVTTRSPLSMPPSDSLLLPDSNATRPQEQSIRQQALEILSPDVALERNKDVPSEGQTALVQQATQSANQNRQHELMIDNGFVDQVMFWNSGKPSDLAVDGAAENKRIHGNLSLGVSPDHGATPTTDKK